MTVQFKKAAALILALICLAMALALPVGAAVPQNGLIAAARRQITATVGVDTAGAAVILVQGGNVMMLEGVGYADMVSRRLITPETVFEIGKISGVITALVAYILAEEGTISLTADVTRYLPEDFADRLDLSYPITVEQLLLGSAGFEGRTFDLTFSKDAYHFETLEEALTAQIPRQIAAPGSFYSYSPFGIALVAYVIECVTGQTYEAYAQGALLEPLGMKNTILNPTLANLPETAAVGHVATANGQFSAMAEGGRTYGALYPANGAISTAEDLSRLLAFLLSDNESGILSTAARERLLQSRYSDGAFTLSAPAMSVQGDAIGVSSANIGFSAALWFGAAGEAALVLTNTAVSALTALPATLCGATVGAEVQAGGALPELETFEGYYADTAGESSSFVGRFLRRESNAEAKADEDGTLSFLGMRLSQIAPGIFADADGNQHLAVVQFVLNAEGRVEKVVTADGRSYLAVGLFEQRLPATILLALLALLSAWFVGAGLFSVLRYLASRYEGREREGFVYTLPLIFAGLIGLCTFLQMVVGMKYGGAAFASFFYAMSVITMVFCIGALTMFLAAFMASLTRRGMTARVARAALLFLVYVFMIRYWGLLIL